jgi:hypothetical protein
LRRGAALRQRQSAGSRFIERHGGPGLRQERERRSCFCVNQDQLSATELRGCIAQKLKETFVLGSAQAEQDSDIRRSGERLRHRVFVGHCACVDDLEAKSVGDLVCGGEVRSRRHQVPIGHERSLIGES